MSNRAVVVVAGGTLLFALALGAVQILRESDPSSPETVRLHARAPATPGQSGPEPATIEATADKRVVDPAEEGPERTTDAPRTSRPHTPLSPEVEAATRRMLDATKTSEPIDLGDKGVMYRVGSKHRPVVVGVRDANGNLIIREVSGSPDPP